MSSTSPCKGPPRARIARARSGRGAQLVASTRSAAASIPTRHAGAPPRRSRRLAGRVFRSPRLATVVILAALEACRPARPARAPSPAPPSATRAFLVREAQLEGGAVSVDAEIPLEPAGPKPTVIALLGDSRALLAAGFVVVTYQIQWAILKGEKPPAPPPEGTGLGKWLRRARGRRGRPPHPGGGGDRGVRRLPDLSPLLEHGHGGKAARARSGLRGLDPRSRADRPPGPSRACGPAHAQPGRRSADPDCLRRPDRASARGGLHAGGGLGAVSLRPAGCGGPRPRSRRRAGRRGVVRPVAHGVVSPAFFR